METRLVRPKAPDTHTVTAARCLQFKRHASTPNTTTVPRVRKVPKRPSSCCATAGCPAIAPRAARARKLARVGADENQERRRVPSFPAHEPRTPVVAHPGLGDWEQPPRLTSQPRPSSTSVPRRTPLSERPGVLASRDHAPLFRITPERSSRRPPKSNGLRPAREHRHLC